MVTSLDYEESTFLCEEEIPLDGIYSFTAEYKSIY